MATWCKPCSAFNATTDLVKVDLPALNQQAEEQEEGARLRAQLEAEEAARRQAEGEAEAEAEAERARARADAEARLRAAEQEEETRRALEKHRLAEAAAAEERARREREEQQRRVEEAARAEEMERQRADRAKAAVWLKKNGFSDVASKKKKGMFSSTYALHVAVKENDADMIRCLLAAGADPTLKNSSGQTPAQLAMKSSRKDSHAACIDALGGVPRATLARGGA